MDDHLLHAAGRLFPAGHVQRQPFWKRDGRGQNTPAHGMTLTTLWAIDAVLIEKNSKKCQRKMDTMAPSVS
jgi:hypothetical protein